MLGYVIINKNELSPRDFDIYRGYYCGVCKSIGRRHGQIPRLALSYDSVFLAMVMASLRDEVDEIKQEHCIIHPIKKNPVIRTSNAVDYAADILLILAYHNFLDDKKDEHKVRGTVGSTLLKNAYKKLEKEYPKLCREIESQISDVSLLESSKCESLDMVAEAFGKVLEAAFKNFSDTNQERVLGNLGFNLGRWIYVMDALDDLEDDRKSGSYNPLIYRKKGKEGLEDLLYNYLGQVSNAIDLLEIKKNQGIIDNVIWNGLRARTDLLLKERDNNGRSI